MNVSARFPGSSNDMHIWNNSNALNYITALHRNGHNSFYFIGKFMTIKADTMTIRLYYLSNESKSFEKKNYTHSK